MGLNANAERRSPKYSLFDLWPVVVAGGPVVAGVALLRTWAAPSSESIASRMFGELNWIVPLLAACSALYGWSISTLRHERLWVSTDRIGIGDRSVPRAAVSKVVVLGGLDRELDLILVCNAAGEVVLRAKGNPHPRWRWVRFLSAQGLPLTVQPWTAPLVVNPVRLVRLLRSDPGDL